MFLFSHTQAEEAKLCEELHIIPIHLMHIKDLFMRESYTKAFKPMSLGVIELPAGRGEMTLRATEIPGGQVLEFRRLMLRRVDQ